MVSRQPRRSTLRALLACSLTALAIAVAGCGGDGGGTEADVAVSASTTELANIAAHVGGERAEVTGILPANADPHEYEPRPSDAESVAEADLILQSGGELDLWLDELVESSGSEAPVETMLDSVHTIEGDDGVDPHWWQNPANAITAAEVIRDQLIEVDPDGRETYERNADRYIAKVEKLDRRIEECMSGIPDGERRLVTSHDALGYFAERYDIEVVGAVIPALTTQAQPSAGETQQLIDLIDEEHVKAVFPEAGVSAELEQTVADETGAVIGDELWADTLGPEGSTGETYLEATAHNADALADGFTGGEGGCGASG